jgi:hypothetical protein
LVLAGFEERGSPNVQRFQIGDVAGMVDVIMAFEGHPEVNLYAPWAVMRRDLEPGEKGRETDVVAVLAAVGDLDNDKGKFPLDALPVAPPYIVESSPGNFQAVYAFAQPLPAREAKAPSEALCNFIGGDTGTKDASHVWRIPGTRNFPTKSKLKRGRSPLPVPASVKKAFDGRLIDPRMLTALAPATKKPNGHDDDAPVFSLSAAETARLRDVLRVIPADVREIWLKAGMALHLVGARDIWDEEPYHFERQRWNRRGKLSPIGCVRTSWPEGASSRLLLGEALSTAFSSICAIQS